MNIIVTGTLGYDYIMDFSGLFAERIIPERIDKLSLSFLVDKMTKNFGGTAGNIAYNLKMLGIDPVLLSSAGNDFDPYLKFLTAQKIDTSQISIHQDVATSSYFVVSDRDHNQIGSFYVGATKYAIKLPLAEMIDKSSQDQFVVISPTDPKAMIKYVSICRNKKIPYLFDPAFQIATFSIPELKESIGDAQILIGNDYEISLIESKLEISHEDLRFMVPILITTLGGKGSIIETAKESIHVKPITQCKVVDPTGAGDAYRAGFLTGFAKGLDLKKCGQMGSVAAVYAVENNGTINHKYNFTDFCKRYQEDFNEPLSLT
jgi:adenosine kinase